MSSWAADDDPGTFGGMSAEERAFGLRLQMDADRRREEQEFSAPKARKGGGRKVQAHATARGGGGGGGGGGDADGSGRPPLRGGPGGKGGKGGKGGGKGVYRGAVPGPDYVCHRCGRPGHWLQHCPEKDNPDFARHRVQKRGHGVPHDTCVEVNQVRTSSYYLRRLTPLLTHD